MSPNASERIRFRKNRKFEKDISGRRSYCVAGDTFYALQGTVIPRGRGHLSFWNEWLNKELAMVKLVRKKKEKIRSSGRAMRENVTGP